jgi:hypothetical protein
LTAAAHAHPGRFPIRRAVDPGRYPCWRNGVLWGDGEGIEWGLWVRSAVLLHLMIAMGPWYDDRHVLEFRVHLCRCSFFARVRCAGPMPALILFLYLDRYRGTWKRVAYIRRGDHNLP